MNNQSSLPQDYEQIYELDLQKDKKLAVFVNLLAIVIAVVMTVPMCFLVPITTLFDMSQGIGAYSIRFITIAVSMIVYMVLHELVHGAFIRIYSGKNATYGFTGLYAYAASNSFFNKKSYIIIALAPIIILGIVLLILNIAIPISWFWVIYLIQIMNISGAAGDMYVTVKFSRMPKDILVFDHGVGMKVYARKQ